MRVILFIFALAGLTNAARQSGAEVMDAVPVIQGDDPVEQRRSIARGTFTPRVAARRHTQRAGP